MSFYMESVKNSTEYLINDACHKILEYLYSNSRMIIRESTYGKLNDPDETKKLLSDTYVVVPTSKFENIIGCTSTIFELALKKLKSNNHIDALKTNNKIDRVRLLDNDEIEESGKAAYELSYYLSLNEKLLENDRIKYRLTRAEVLAILAIIATLIAGIIPVMCNKPH